MADTLATLASMFQLTPHRDLPYIEFWCHGKPAHCCQVEEERDGKPWFLISSDMLKAFKTFVIKFYRWIVNSKSEVLAGK